MMIDDDMTMMMIGLPFLGHEMNFDDDDGDD